LISRQEFIDAYRHVFGGIVLDAATNQHRGEALSAWLRTVLSKVDALLGAMHDRLSKPTQVAK
jgi:hypothetical protein